jgi:2-polyprenyl-6-methoxyphenol hydroxylase-like FAD-dependent oxidoreductase
MAPTTQARSASASASVLVVGAGPTGLALALCLRTYGVGVDVFDVKAEPALDSKGIAINPLTCHMLDLIGEPHALGTGAQRVRRLAPRFGSTRLLPVDLRWLDHEHDAFLVQPQPATERALLAALVRRGGAVRWRTEVEGVAADDTGVVVRWRDDHGTRASGRYDYVVGCDGKRSLVREAIGATLEGPDYPMHLVLGDFRLRWDAPRDEASYIIDHGTFFVLVPLPDGQWRVVVAHPGRPPRGAPVVEAITEPLRRLLGADVVAAGPTWISSAPLYTRVASRMAAGRVLIAGDAAHLFSPLGGTGMNTGIQDALALGWRLAFVLRGWSRAERILGSYELERLAAARANAAATDATTRAVAGLDPSPAFVSRFLPRASNRHELRHALPLQLSGLGLRYPASPALAPTAADSTCAVGRVSLGLPALLRSGPGLPTAGAPIHVVAAPIDERDEAALQALVAACRRHAPAVACLAVASSDPATPPPARLAIPRVELDPIARRRLGLAAGRVHVVRPDGIIAYDAALRTTPALLDPIAGLVEPASEALEP